MGSLLLDVDDLQPFLTPNPLPSRKQALVTAWCPVLGALLMARYGDRITDDNKAVFASTAADAIQRRLDKPNSMVVSQSVNGAAVTYSGSLRSWFHDAELAQLDALVGPTGTRSVRMSAPDSVRFGNVLSNAPEGSSGF